MVRRRSGQVSPYAPEGGPLRARGKRFGLYGNKLSSRHHTFSTGLCRLCNTSLQLDVEKRCKKHIKFEHVTQKTKNANRETMARTYDLPMKHYKN